MSELRDSQLSAMYDGELPPAECELLARRLTRDPALRAEWSRYALIGAALRGEPAQAARRAGMRTRAQAMNLALPVSQALGTTDIAGRDATADGPDGRRWRKALRDWAQPLLGAGIAAGVAALSIVWLQGRVGEQAPGLSAQADEIVLGDPDLVASRAALAGVIAGQPDAASQPAASATSRAALVARAGGNEPRSYTVPPLGRESSPRSDFGLADAQLANYVVAHSEYAAPLNRRSVLSALIVNDAASLVANPAATPEPAREQVAP
jgi:negative regulator of sigma E activity